MVLALLDVAMESINIEDSTTWMYNLRALRAIRKEKVFFVEEGRLDQQRIGEAGIVRLHGAATIPVGAIQWPNVL